MATWEGEHGVFGRADEEMCQYILAGVHCLPDFYEVSNIQKPIKAGTGFVLMEQGDFHPRNECNPCIAFRLLYTEHDGQERAAAEIFAPFQDPDTGEEIGWAVTARNAYNELVDAVIWRTD